MGTFLLLTVWFGFMIFIVQRTEARRRRTVTWLMVVLGVLTLIWSSTREMVGLALGALILGLVMNFLFWLLIGRYNPVGSSDDIQVIGLDD